MNTAPNSPFKGYYPNVNPFGISPRYNGNTPLYNLYNKYKTEDVVNDTISKVDNKEDANAEIEQGEIVRQDLPNGGTLLHKALGKKHKDGGIPVNLPNNSFIFSNFKTTSLNKEELETFKLGGFSKKVNNMTPAKILEKNVDIKHYNEMEKYLQESKDSVQLKTAQLMKEKYDKVVAKVAALQESKKPNTNIPNFAYLTEDTPELKEQEIMTQQYREGGHVLPKFQLGSFYNKFDPLAMYLNPDNVYMPNNPAYTNSGHQSRNGKGYGDSPELNQYTQDWYKRVSGEDFEYTPEKISKLQQLYSKYHKEEWGQGFNSGIGKEFDGNMGNITNSYYFNKVPIKGTQAGEIDLNDYFKKTPNEQIAISKQYGIDPKQMEQYKISGKAKVIINPDGSTSQPEVNTESSNAYVAPATNGLTNEEGDKFNWVKPYDWSPKALSMLGNMAQYPRAYNPALSLEQPVRLREQQINAQPGVNDILANRYMSMKASNQYAPNSIANSQFIDSDANKQIMDYRNQVNQANLNVATDIHNKNAVEQNRVVNSNNDRRAQYSDKMNELYQNMANERNTINATNLNLLGQGLQEQNAYNQNVDLLKRQYGWNVQNGIKQQMSSKELEAEIQKINNSNMDENVKKTWLMHLAKKYYQTQPALQNPYS